MTRLARAGAKTAALAALVVLAACAVQTGQGARAPAAETDASGPLRLADHPRLDARAAARRFSEDIARRYAAGAPLPTVLSDLRAAQFRCGPSRHRLGDPPDQVCRRSLDQSGCAHVWQVFLYQDGPSATGLSRVRAVYDRACGPEPLLGGQG